MNLYYNAAVDTDWNTLGNWWQDDQFTVPADALPTSADDVYLYANVDSNGGNEPTVNAVYGGSVFTLSIAITTGYATYFSIGAEGVLNILNEGTLYGVNVNGTVNGDCTLDTCTIFGGVVNGDCNFINQAYNYGTVNGNATFDEGSTNSLNINTQGIVTGDATFAMDGEYSYGMLGTVSGVRTFTGNNVSFRLAGEDSWTYDTTNWVFPNCVPFWSFYDSSYNSGAITDNCTFNDISYNTGTVSGNATFNASSYNSGTITDNCTFNNSSYNTGTVSGNATFNDSSSNSGGTVSGDATFNDGSYNTGTVSGNATFNASSYNDFGIVNGDATFNDSSNNNYAGGVTGDATFNDSSSNSGGTVTGNATFNDSSYNNGGTITGDCTFSDSSYNGGTITGDCTFSGNSYSNGSITGNCTFNDSSQNNGDVSGDATFNNGSYTSSISTVTGNATFNDSSYNGGTVIGDATFTASAYDKNPVGAVWPRGTVTFNSASPVAFTITYDNWTADTTYWVFTTAGQSWTFNESSNYYSYGYTLGNSGTLKGDATFNGASYNYGVVNGTTTFNGPASNIGTVNGNAFFSGNSDSFNCGTVNGDATFGGSSRNYRNASINGPGSTGPGGVYGNATFNDYSTNSGWGYYNVTLAGVVSGNATFTNSFYYDDPVGTSSYGGGSIFGTITFNSSSPVSFFMYSDWSLNTSGWVFTTAGQNWTFYYYYVNYGTIYGDCTFNGYSSYNSGTIYGDCTFNGYSSYNYNTIYGACTFYNSSYNYNTIYGACTFYNSSYNYGTIVGICVFHDSSYNRNYITGDCTFYDVSSTGTNYDYGYPGISTGAFITGNCTFRGSSRLIATVSGTSVFYDSAAIDAYGYHVGNCTFNNSSQNLSDGLYMSQSWGISGSAVFNDNSHQTPDRGTISGDVTANHNSRINYSRRPPSGNWWEPQYDVVQTAVGGSVTLNNNAYVYGAVIGGNCQLNDNSYIDSPSWAGGPGNCPWYYLANIGGSCTLRKHAYVKAGAINGNVILSYDKGINGTSILGII